MQNLLLPFLHLTECQFIFELKTYCMSSKTATNYVVYPQQLVTRLSFTQGKYSVCCPSPVSKYPGLTLFDEASLAKTLIYCDRIQALKPMEEMYIGIPVLCSVHQIHQRSAHHHVHKQVTLGSSPAHCSGQIHMYTGAQYGAQYQLNARLFNVFTHMYIDKSA